MFTSRSEYRLTLRPDNADRRLTRRGIEIGCVGELRTKAFSEKEEQLKIALGYVSRETISPTKANATGLTINQDGVKRSILEMLGFPHITFDQLAEAWPVMRGFRADVREQVEIEALYHGYLDRQQADIEMFKQDEKLPIPDHLDYDSVGSLSNEIRDKLKRTKPATIGAASRIPGVTPAAVAAVLTFMKRRSQAA